MLEKLIYRNSGLTASYRTKVFENTILRFLDLAVFKNRFL